jgi:hypothetical protein
MAKLFASATIVLAILSGTPEPVAAQQLYECQYTITITEITTRYASGKTTIQYTYTRTEVCRPI